LDNETKEVDVAWPAGGRRSSIRRRTNGARSFQLRFF